MKKIKQNGRLYRKRERELRETYAPAIVPCKTCGSPRHVQYKCQYCEGE